jgi:pyruvate dehydrogenase (quinone)
MSLTVADALLDRLETWGMHRIYGYPGDGINGLIGALGRTGDRFEFIQTRHEETAALMAVAHAKFTGEVGLCIATSGPGAVHLLNGMYDARKDHQPLVVIVGQQPRSALGADQHQELDLHSLFSNVAADFCETVTVPEQAQMVIDRAIRIARTRNTVTAVILPNDVQDLDAVGTPPRAHGMQRTSAAIGDPPRVLPTDGDLRAAADVLRSGERVAILIGSGARAASAEVLAISDALGAGIAKALLGKDVLADDLPNVTGSIGLLGTRASWQMMDACDTLLMIGTSFPYTEFLPDTGAARAVQIDIDPTRTGMRFPTEVNLVGDATLTLRALLDLLDHAGPSDAQSSWRARVEHWIRDWRDTLDVQPPDASDERPIDPRLVARELSRSLPDHAIVTADSGTSVSWYARYVDLRPGMRGSVSGQLASMGVGVPYAIGAKLAHPDRPVVTLLGDGSMQMNGLAELLTIQRYRDRFTDPRLVVAVLNNSDLNMVTWEQRVMAGDPRFAASQDLPQVNYAAVAQSMGMHAIRVEDPANVAAAWRDAWAAGEPTLLDFVVDPDVPPMPPHVTFEEAKHLMFALARGDSERLGVARRGIESVLGHSR